MTSLREWKLNTYNVCVCAYHMPIRDILTRLRDDELYTYLPDIGLHLIYIPIRSWGVRSQWAISERYCYRSQKSCFVLFNLSLPGLIYIIVCMIARTHWLYYNILLPTYLYFASRWNYIQFFLQISTLKVKHFLSLANNWIYLLI